MCSSDMYCLSVLACICFIFVSSYRGDCPCEKPEYCNPINRNVRNEIYVFSTTNSTETWLQYDWTKITTIVMIKHNPKNMCLAHKHGAKVVYLADYPLKSLKNATARSEWVKSNLQFTKDNFLDGINIDFEQPISKYDFWLRRDYTSLVRETYTAFKNASKFYQISIDIPYSPRCIYGRCYDYKGLSSVTDFMVIMAYDEWDRELDHNVAGAVGNYVKTKTGIAEYIDLPVPAYQLLLAVPWYGDWYPCANVSEDKRECNLGKLQGVAQLDYSDIIQNVTKNATTPMMFDNTTLSNFFNLWHNNMTFQIWFDDPKTLTYKYNLALDFGLRGIGMWQADCVDFKKDPTGFKAMWEALPRYNNTV